VVTVVFADLVGFTSKAERLDPEDVRATLAPYYARLRAELERHGGTVEKFIGDAVMALFGAPVAHEDDPERAVRAALAIRDWVLEQEELQVRIAVNTGEALVALGARPGEGEGMASGDIVNTTARLQSAAPVNGILVGEITYRATSHVIDYRPSDPVTAKGKAEPLRVWQALQARSRLGTDVATAPRTAMVGRARELDVLSDALAGVRRNHAPHLVTLSGVPGIGKSRLIAELFRQVSDDPTEIMFWRQGRSLPYGDGVTFWALAEMVKAHAGILETESAQSAAEKLRTAVAAVISDPSDVQWVEGHLRPLVGLSAGDAERGGERQSETFTAWRRFFEALAERRPLVLVFEDLQWADSNLLDFVEYLIDWASGVPLLVVCSARPELFERRSGWGGGKRNATTLSLAPLTEDETTKLISSLSQRPVMPVETQEALLARAGGNPLYAEQYVRMLAERPDAETLPLPETVHGIIAARLDGLPLEEKSLLQNAAVIGKVFWLGAATRLGGLDRLAAELHLHALGRKDFVQRARRSSVANEAEYAFLHVLVRDVAYGQIPRAQRAEKHRLAAEWIAALGRTEDHAEMLAHHYKSALELQRAAGQPVDPPFAQRAMGSIGVAGDRAFSLSALSSAAGFYQSALDLAAPGSVEHARLLFKLGRTRFRNGNFDPEPLLAASRALLGHGDAESAAEAEAVLGELFRARGEADRALEHLSRARELVEARDVSRAKAFVAGALSRFMMLASQDAEAIRLGRDALGMAELLDLDDLRASTLNNIGVSRVHSGDLGGFEDLEESIAVAVRANAPVEIFRAKGNLASLLWQHGELERANALFEEAAAVVTRFGLRQHERFVRGERGGYLYARGDWNEALISVDQFLAEVEAGSPHYAASYCYLTRAQIRLGQDHVTQAIGDVERGIVLARLAKDPQNLEPTVAAAAHVFHEIGMVERASGLVDELLASLREQSGLIASIDTLHMLAWTLSGLGRGRELIDFLPTQENRWVQAAAAYAEGNLQDAADTCAAMGAVTEEAHDRLWLAGALVNQNRRAEAETQLQRAIAFYRSVGATRYLRQGEALLATSHGSSTTQGQPA
jgi:class 3 adenylate cyclase/tetratricopeptide (TPR) repeat protein